MWWYQRRRNTEAVWKIFYLEEKFTSGFIHLLKIIFNQFNIKRRVHSAPLVILNIALTSLKFQFHPLTSFPLPFSRVPFPSLLSVSKILHKPSCRFYPRNDNFKLKRFQAKRTRDLITFPLLFTSIKNRI